MRKPQFAQGMFIFLMQSGVDANLRVWLGACPPAPLRCRRILIRCVFFGHSLGRASADPIVQRLRRVALRRLKLAGTGEDNFSVSS